MITDSEEEGDEFEPPPLSAGPVGVTKPRSNTAFAALPSSPYTPTTPYTPTGGGSGGAEVFTGFNRRTASVRCGDCVWGYGLYGCSYESPLHILNGGSIHIPIQSYVCHEYRSIYACFMSLIPIILYMYKWYFY